MKTSQRCEVLLVSLFVMAGGCASSARMTQMTVTTPDAARHAAATPLRDNVTVKDVSGGDKTNPLWKSEIGNDEFRGALESSLKSAGLLEGRKGGGKYALSAKLTGVDQPLFGFNTTVTTHVAYVLTDTATGKALLDESVSAEFTAKVSDAFLGVKRLQIANEGAARANIAQSIEKLLRLGVPQGDVTLPR
jgi:hypothetical protein